MSIQTTKTMEAASEWCLGAVEGTLGGAETILLVEDEAFVREVTCEVLRAVGYRVLTAKNAAEAVWVYDAYRREVKLLLTDVVLPGETGRALAVRLQGANPGLKVLLVTGYVSEMRLREGEAEECLAKPFSTEVLLRKVRQLLDGSRFLMGTEDPLKHAGGSV